jgi:chromosomal replication initiation ATPase DnaA
MTLVEFICNRHRLDLSYEIGEFRKAKPDIDYFRAMVKTAYESFGTTEKELLSVTRKREIVMQRHTIMYFLYKTQRFSLVSIGKMFNREHSTTIHAIEKVECFLSYNDKQFLYYYTPLKRCFDNLNTIDLSVNIVNN